MRFSIIVIIQIRFISANTIFLWNSACTSSGGCPVIIWFIGTFRYLYCLKALELWRILKLTDIDFISRLVNLEKLSLQDLKHITALPNLDPLTKLHDIRINNVPIDRDALDERIRSMVHY